LNWKVTKHFYETPFFPYFVLEEGVIYYPLLNGGSEEPLQHIVGPHLIRQFKKNLVTHGCLYLKKKHLKKKKQKQKKNIKKYMKICQWNLVVL
jgi:hypothetical protein